MPPNFFDTPRTLVDIGAGDVNGSYRNVFSNERVNYIGVDLTSGPGVDCVLEDPYSLPFPDGHADLVISGQMLEHCEFFWRAFEEMTRILKPDGRLFLIAPSSGPIHAYPVDCYRYYPDAYKALAKHAGCHLVSVWMDERGPWNDLVGVFSRDASRAPIYRNTSAIDNTPVRPRESALELTSGQEPYLEFLARVHKRLDPRTYLEIGVRTGASLRLAKMDAIGIDPVKPSEKLPANARFFNTTSDDFFDLDVDEAISRPIDLAFIDGMHLFEFALRDFIQIEQRCNSSGLIIIDDVFPAVAEQGRRKRETAIWMGDVWKIGDCLKRYRPDLQLTFVDTAPSGVLLVANLSPGNDVLQRNYNEIVQHYVNVRTEDPPPPVLNRRNALSPDHEKIAALLGGLASSRLIGENTASES